MPGDLRPLLPACDDALRLLRAVRLAHRFAGPAGEDVRERLHETMLSCIDLLLDLQVASRPAAAHRVGGARRSAPSEWASLSFLALGDLDRLLRIDSTDQREAGP